MQEMFSKLSSYAALLGVIGAIGGGFMAWGEFNNRIAQLENQEFIVNETVDLSGIIKELEALKGDIKINDLIVSRDVASLANGQKVKIKMSND